MAKRAATRPKVAILGSGEVALILDVAALVKIVTRKEEERLLPNKNATSFSALASTSSAIQSGR